MQFKHTFLGNFWRQEGDTVVITRWEIGIRTGPPVPVLVFRKLYTGL